MLQSCIILAWFVVFTASTPPSSFGWREALSIVGLLSPVVFGIIIYLIKKRSEAEVALQKEQLKTLARDHTTALKDLRDYVDNTLREIESTYKAQLATSVSSLAQHKEDIQKLEHAVQKLTDKVQATAQDNLIHQNSCSSRYVERSAYANDISAQKEHIRTIKELVNQQIEMVEKLVRM